MAGPNRGAPAGPFGNHRMWAAKSAGVVLVLLLVASCRQSQTGFDCHSRKVGSVDEAGNVAMSDLAGIWLTTPGFDDVKMTLEEDGTFTWENRRVPICDTGTWTADGTRLTFAFAEDDPFCAGETLTWEYQLESDRLTSEGVADTCPGPASAHDSRWGFERQGVG